MKKFIVSDPQILFGTPVITGTRIPIQVILLLVKQGNSLKQIQKMYDWVEMEKLEGAIDETINLVDNSFNAKGLL